MRWIADIKDAVPLDYIIQQDSKAGFYLYLYRGNFCICDDLQETFERAANQASQEYNIPTNAWKNVKGDSTKWVANINRMQSLRFIIERDKQSKFHVCIYQNDNKLYDNPKRSLEDAKDFALKKLHLPRLFWKELQ